jgi:hypothetical protein
MAVFFMAFTWHDAVNRSALIELHKFSIELYSSQLPALPFHLRFLILTCRVNHVDHAYGIAEGLAFVQGTAFDWILF